ncbi:MAG: rRNA maturation RNase YbeY [Spirochaetes bacterium]|nr:rRNA maturation RNase YbeY [Spirochaetota bacterium]
MERGEGDVNAPDNRAEIRVEGIPPLPWTERLRSWILDALAGLGKESWDLSVVLCGDGFISDLNREYRGKEGPTDVLSFPLGDFYGEGGERRFLAGDVVVSLPALSRNASDFDVDESEELKRLVLHGMLHLSGMDHASNDPGEPMLALQERILKRYTEVVIF